MGDEHKRAGEKHMGVHDESEVLHDDDDHKNDHDDNVHTCDGDGHSSATFLPKCLLLGSPFGHQKYHEKGDDSCVYGDGDDDADDADFQLQMVKMLLLSESAIIVEL